MPVTKKLFGHRPVDGAEVEEIVLQSASGLRASLLTYGGVLHRLDYAGKDLVLGYDRLEDYIERNGSYQGAMIGRYANRIAGGKFRLGGALYDVGCNEAGRGHLHGGAGASTRSSGRRRSWRMETRPASACRWFRRMGKRGIPAGWRFRSPSRWKGTRCALPTGRPGTRIPWST